MKCQNSYCSNKAIKRIASLVPETRVYYNFCEPCAKSFYRMELLFYILLLAVIGGVLIFWFRAL